MRFLLGTGVAFDRDLSDFPCYLTVGSYGHLGRNYTIGMGRSKSVVGPYVDKDGRELTKFYPDINAYGASFLLGNDSNHLVPGHPHIWQEEDRFFLGYDYRILLHPDREEMDYMGIRELYWANGWPTIWIPIKLTFTAPSELQGQELEIALSNSGQPSSVVAFDDLKVTKGSVE